MLGLSALYDAPCQIAATEEPHNKASANKENPSIITWIFSPQMLFLFILCIGNKASLAIRYEMNWLLEMCYCRVPP